MDDGIVVTRAALRNTLSDEGYSTLKDAFARDHVVRLPGFFSPDLLDDFRKRLEGASFSHRVEDGIEIELTLEEPAPLALAMVPMNDPALFAAIDRITGCGSIGCFTGRVHMRHASSDGGHYYPWHTDAIERRLVGVTVNLSDDPFEGGVLELRRRRSRRVIAHVANRTPGDAVLFRISPNLEHHVTPVTTTAPRLVLAGWFRRSPDFWSKARECASS